MTAREESGDARGKTWSRAFQPRLNVSISRSSTRRTSSSSSHALGSAGAEATALRSAASAWAARPRARHARPSTRRVELVAPPLALILRQSSSAVVQSPAWAAASARLRIAVSSLPPISLNPSSTTAIPPSAAKRIRNQSLRRARIAVAGPSDGESIRFGKTIAAKSGAACGVQIPEKLNQRSCRRAQGTI